DFQQFIDTIRQKLDGEGKDDSGEQRKASLRRAEMELDEADEMKQYKDVHAQLARSALLSSSSHPGAFTSDEPYGPTSDRTRLLLRHADILLNLRQQREQIINSRDTLQTANTSIDRASGTLKGMIKGIGSSRMYQQRVVTGAIIVVLILLIGIILYEKLS
ncbi:hypothetical protein B0H14DRAFT_2935856, partial [Mycena olivaceomarginata]